MITFTDKKYNSKLKYIDKPWNKKLNGLTTNFIIPSENEIIDFISLKKLNQLAYSVFMDMIQSFF